MTPWDGQPTFEGDVPKPVAARVPRGPSGRLRRVKPGEVVVNRADLEWAIMWISLAPPDAEKLPEARAAYNRLAAPLLTEDGSDE